MKDFKSLLSGILIIGCSVAANAMPAKQSPVSGSLADGTPVTAVQYGDEFFHYYISLSDGSMMVRDGETFVPADLSPERRRQARDRRVQGLVPSTTFPAKGAQKVAVVLVEYQDVKFNLEDPLDYFTRMLNEEGFSDYHATGSARDWFIHSSFGQFEPEFIVMGPVTLQKNREYYGGNDAWGQDSAPQKMVIEACRQLNAEVDFSEFDRDNDGYIDNVFVVYAGRGEASGGSSDCVWPHSWNLSAAEPGSNYTFDGVRLNRYACTNEWELSDLGYGYRPVGIGSFVHEFAHVMGLPDLYATDYSGDRFTLGAWSAMDYGPYNNDMCTPPQFSAWERASLGYMEPELLPADAANRALEPLEEGKAYMVATENPDEFYILENRQQSGWDAYIPGHGLLVWHIDYDSEVWRTNSVNNDASHNHVDLIEADGILDETSRHGDSFPGSAGVTSLSLKSWSGKDLGYSLSDISEIGLRLAFRVNGGDSDIAAPRVTEVTEIKPSSFNVNWEGVTGASGYFLNLTGPDGLDVLSIAGADERSHTFDGLTPDTEYFFTLRADDGCFGSAPAERQRVTTAPPTFDYFVPSLLAPSEIGSDRFTANWLPLEGAQSYTLNLYTREEGEAVSVTEDFSGDIENLVSGWTSTSKVTYGMASYSGESIPSLRMATDGDNLSISKAGTFVKSLEFWQRGNSTSDAEAITIDGFDGREWQEVVSIPVVTAQGGSHEAIDFDAFKWEAVRIRFNRPSKGSLAIDDVTASFVSPVDRLVKSLSAPGNATSIEVTGLEPLTTYRYGLTATDGEYATRESERMEITTADGTSGVESLPGGEGPYVIYDLSGRRLGSGEGTYEIPASKGVYIITRVGETPKKIFVK